MTLSDLKTTVFKMNCAFAFAVVCFALIEGGAYVVFKTMAERPAQSPVSHRAAAAAYRYLDGSAEHRSNVYRFRHDLRYQPYSLWTHTPQHASTLNVDEAWGGIRRTIHNQVSEVGEVDRTIVVYMFGGSTLFCLNSRDAHTLASEVAGELQRRKPNHSFRVINFGVSGYLSDQEVVRLTQVLTEGGRPDLVVFYDGVNDKLNKVAKGIPHFEFQRYKSVESPTQAASSLGLVECLLRYDYIHRIGGVLSGFDRASRYQDYCQDPQTLNRRANQMAHRYRQNVAFTGRLGAASGFEVVHFWQPDLLNTGKRLTREEQALLEEAPAALLREAYRIADEAVLTQVAQFVENRNDFRAHFAG